jgi:hypothetical protein
MTSPFQFPTIGGGGVIQDAGVGGTMASGMIGVLKAMQDSEKLKREKAEFESKQAYFKTLDEGNALDNQKKQDELTATQRGLKAKEGGLAAYSQWVGSGARQGDLGNILASIKDPEVSQDLVNRVTAHFDELNKASQAVKAQSEAKVSQATEGDTIESSRADVAKKQSDANVATATEGDQIKDASAVRKLHQAQAQKALADANAPKVIDPGQLNAMDNIYKTGAGTLGQAAQMSGVPLAPGMNPDQKFEAPGSQRLAIRKAEQKAAAAAVLAANSQIDELEQSGVKISKFTPAKEAIPFDLGHSMVPEQEQRLLGAGGQFISQYNLAVSGKAVTDKEAMRNARQFIPVAGDKQGTLEQKRIMRQSMQQIMYDASKGEGRPIYEIMQSTIDWAKSKGADPATIRFLQAGKMDAIKMEKETATRDAMGTLPPLTAGPEPAQPDSVQALIGTYGP